MGKNGKTSDSRKHRLWDCGWWLLLHLFATTALRLDTQIEDQAVQSLHLDDGLWTFHLALSGESYETAKRFAQATQIPQGASPVATAAGATIACRSMWRG